MTTPPSRSLSAPTASGDLSGDAHSFGAEPASRLGRSWHRYRGFCHRVFRIADAPGGAVSAAHICPPILRYCKRGHLRTEESTFPRKARINGKEYIGRECRVCHAMRNNRAPSWSRLQSNSKWSDVRGGGR